MPSDILSNDLTELEAAILLYVATVVADGKVVSAETVELDQQFKIIVQTLRVDEQDFDARLSSFVRKLFAPGWETTLRLDRTQIKRLAGRIEDEELKVLVMNAIFEIAFSDDQYDDNEKLVITTLRDCWGI